LARTLFYDFPVTTQSVCKDTRAAPESQLLVHIWPATGLLKNFLKEVKTPGLDGLYRRLGSAALRAGAFHDTLKGTNPPELSLIADI
jgi:hypothetical protein